MRKFKVGDIVRATVEIHRVDWTSVLKVGERATITSVGNGNSDCQIIGLKIEGKLPMGSIVCFDEFTPLRKVEPETMLKASASAETTSNSPSALGEATKAAAIRYRALDASNDASA